MVTSPHSARRNVGAQPGSGVSCVLSRTLATVTLTAAVLVFSVHIPTVGDEGELPTSLPTLVVPQVPWTLHTLAIVAPYHRNVGLTLRPRRRA